MKRDDASLMRMALKTHGDNESMRVMVCRQVSAEQQNTDMKMNSARTTMTKAAHENGQRLMKMMERARE